MTTDAAPYVIRHTTKGLTGWALKQTVQRLKIGQPAQDAVAILDRDGVHWSSTGMWDENAGVPFLLRWDEIDRVVEKRFLGYKGLAFERKDYDAVVARHPYGKRFEGMGKRHCFIPERFAPVDEVKANIRRFSDVPFTTK